MVHSYLAPLTTEHLPFVPPFDMCLPELGADETRLMACLLCTVSGDLTRCSG